MIRRQFFPRLGQLLGIGLLGLGAANGEEVAKPKTLKVMMKSAWGSDDPTRASFVFAHGLALADAGHEVQIFLTGEATYLMRKATLAAIFPVGWPPLSEMRDRVVAKQIPVFACGVCSRARGVGEADLKEWNAKFGSPTIFVSLVEWADRIITE
jgi:predicted peroxiredoxin